MLCHDINIIYLCGKIPTFHVHDCSVQCHSRNMFLKSRFEPIMLSKQPIMLLSSAQKLSLFCSKLCSLNQHYARKLTVLLEYIKIS